MWADARPDMDGLAGAPHEVGALFDFDASDFAILQAGERNDL